MNFILIYTILFYYACACIGLMENPDKGSFISDLSRLGINADSDPGEILPEQHKEYKKTGFFFWWWWWWPYWYYPYWYANGKVTSKASFKQISEKKFQAASAKSLKTQQIGSNLDSTGEITLKTIRTSAKESYSALWNNKTNSRVCPHSIDTDVMMAWLEKGKKEEDDFLCPQCNEDA